MENRLTLFGASNQLTRVVSLQGFAAISVLVGFLS